VVNLIEAFGPWRRAVEMMDQVQLGKDVRELEAVAQAVETRHPDVEVLVDPAELRGFDYHTGLSFVLYAKGVRGELGRGGLYQAGDEQAAGFTLYMDSVLRALPAQTLPEKVRVSADTDINEIARRRAAGEIIVVNLA
jgi:ATP phosphoribosyltransferase regulatory subunit